MQEQSKGLKIFGIVAILVGVVRFVVMVWIASQAKMENLRLTMMKNGDLEETLRKSKMTWEQMANGIRVGVYFFAALALVFGVIIGILAIKGSKTGKVTALKVMLIIQIVALVGITLFSMIKPIFAIMSAVAFVLAIVGLVLAIKTKKQSVEQ